MARAALSAIICTLNEERDLPATLASLGFADEIVVLDCGSEDRTVEIAREAGARVEHQAWLGYSAQKNEAARRASHDWIFSIDADEVVTPELAEAIGRALESDPDPRDGFWLDRRGDFLGHMMLQNKPAARLTHFVRLYNRTHSHWDEEMQVHERLLVPGKRHPLGGLLLHINRFTFDELVLLFNRYATVEAEVLVAKGRRTTAFGVIAWPVARFLWLVIGRRHYRAGAHGIVHAGLRAVAEYLRRAKAWEMQLPPGGDAADHGHEVARREAARKR